MLTSRLLTSSSLALSCSSISSALTAASVSSSPVGSWATLPVWASYFAHRLPHALQSFSVVATLVIEIGVPFLIFAIAIAELILNLLLITCSSI